MRYPLRLQIMLPMAGVMLLAVFAVAVLGALLAVRAAQERVSAQLASVTRILKDSNFPLTNSVLRQMQALSGGEYILVNKANQVLATSGSAKRFIESLPGHSAEREQVAWGDRVWSRDRGYLHAVVPLSEHRTAADGAALHLFYPEEEYRRAWQRAIFPSLAFTALALPVVMLLSAVTARKISGRMSRLQGQVERIARGDFQQLALGERDDEIRALGQAVNQMAAMLTQYEQEIRRTERMRTLAFMGGGIAHQLRNLATGCNLALDLHSQECATGENCESLAVAKRQLRLMEDYLQRFLQLGRPSDALPAEQVDMAKLIDELLPLVRPAARHAGIELDWNTDQPPAENVITGNAQLLSLLVMNLLGNAIDAAAQEQAKSHTAGRVTIELSKPTTDQFMLSVTDTGAGPAAEVEEQLFEPFVTSRPDGVGLGLTVARDVALRHGGQIHWRRAAGKTRFEVELPCHVTEMQCA